MPERSTITQVVQIGVESTPGTAVAANKKLASLQIMPKINVEADEFKPTGQKYASLVAVNQEWTEADVSGKPCYDEVVYPLAGILGAPVITTVGTTGKQHAFTPLSSGDDAIKTFTVEQGSAVRAHSFPYGLLTSLGIDFSRKSIDLNGTMLGQRITDGITLTAAPTSLPLVPFLPTGLDFYLDVSAAALGTTKLTRGISAKWKLDNKAGAAWFVNSANSSFTAHVETDPTNEVALMLEADAVGMGLLPTLRAGDTKFLRVEVTGPTISTGPATYKATFDFALNVNAGTEWKDEDGIFAVEWPCSVVHDATWGSAFKVAIINSLAAL